MDCPSKEKVLRAAATSVEARKALKELFPHYFGEPLKAGQIYEWGTDSDGYSVLLVEYGESLLLVNFITGKVLTSIDSQCSSHELSSLIYEASKEEPNRREWRAYRANNRLIIGPKYFKSWVTR